MALLGVEELEQTFDIGATTLSYYYMLIAPAGQSGTSGSSIGADTEAAARTRIDEIYNAEMAKRNAGQWFFPYEKISLYTGSLANYKTATPVYTKTFPASAGPASKNRYQFSIVGRSGASNADSGGGYPTADAAKANALAMVKSHNENIHDKFYNIFKAPQGGYKFVSVRYYAENADGKRGPLLGEFALDSYAGTQYDPVVNPAAQGTVNIEQLYAAATRANTNTNPATVSPQPGFSQSSRSPTTPAVAPASQAAPQKNALGVVLDAVGLSIGTDKTGMHVGAQPKFWLIVGGIGVAAGLGYWYWRK